MNFNVESVPQGYLPDYQDNLYPPPPIPNSEQMKRTYNIRIQDGKNHVFNTLSEPEIVFYQSLTQFVEITSNLFQNGYYTTQGTLSN